MKKLLKILLFIPKEFMKVYFPKKKKKFQQRATDTLINGHIDEVEEFYREELLTPLNHHLNL